MDKNEKDPSKIQPRFTKNPINTYRYATTFVMMGFGVKQ